MINKNDQQIVNKSEISVLQVGENSVYIFKLIMRAKFSLLNMQKIVARQKVIYYTQIISQKNNIYFSISISTMLKTRL